MDKQLLTIAHKPQEFMYRKNPKVRMLIRNYGFIYIELFPREAPKTVAHFLKLVDKGFYDGMTIHRVVKNHLVQTGDPTGTGNGGSAMKLDGEFLLNGHVNRISHLPGVVAMARTEDYNSARSQFFINLKNNSAVFNGQYAAFGYIADKDSVKALKKLSTMKTMKTDTERPVIDIYIDRIDLVPYDIEAMDKKEKAKKEKADKALIKKHNTLDNLNKSRIIEQEKRDQRLQRELEEKQKRDKAAEQREAERLDKLETKYLQEQALKLSKDEIKRRKEDDLEDKRRPEYFKQVEEDIEE